MTPQDLINLPGAGNAEKQLRKMGKWQLTPQEKLAKALDSLNSSIDDAADAIDDAADAIDDAQNELHTIYKQLEATCN